MTWTKRGNLRGPTGLTGAPGKDGAQGVQGQQGQQGIQGQQGPQGRTVQIFPASAAAGDPQGSLPGDVVIDPDTGYVYNVTA